MLRKIYPYLWFSAAMLLACWACSDDDAVTEAADSEAYTLTLQLSSGAMATRVATDAIEAIADLENRMERIDLYFFPKPSADGQVGETSVFKYSATVDDAADTKLGWQTLTVKLPLDKVDDLFGPEGTTCDVYAVVNWNGTDLPKSITRSELDETVVTEALDGKTNNGEMTINGLSTFVMYGQATSENGGEEITLDRTTQTAQGKIWVRHVAAKIRIAADIEKAVYVDAQGNTLMRGDGESDVDWEARISADGVEKWEAQTDNIRAYITNGTMSAQMNGLLEHGQGDQLQEFKPVYFSLTDEEGSRRILTEDTNETEPGNWYWNSIPFYSHPNHWENTPTPDENNRRTYLTVVVPWMKEGEGANREFVPTYYQVPINVTGDSDHEANCLKSNHYYKVYVKIGMLGSFTQEEEVVLDASYKIVDWGQADIDVNITETRFLVVNQTDWVVNGEESVTIPFYSSHDVEVVSVDVTYYRFNDSWPEKKYQGDVHTRTFNDDVNKLTQDQNNGVGVYSYVIDDDAKTLTLTHPMVLWTERQSNRTPVGNNNPDKWPETAYFNDRTTDPEYSKYEFVIVIKHIDQDTNTAFQETLRITQYPSIYIEAEHNPGDYNYIETDPKYSNKDRAAYMRNLYTFVNGRGNVGQTAKYQGWNEVIRLNEWWTEYGLPVEENQNECMYIIHITQLSEAEGAFYSIGDPRTLHINNYLRGNGPITDIADNTTPWSEGIYTGNGNTSKQNSPNDAWDSDDGARWGGNNTAERENFYDAAVTAPAMYNGPSRQIKYYYPTYEANDAGSKENFIAPILRVASSLGKHGNVTKEEARRRCASYQEFGYPAGRWRMPTKAEVEYISNLSAQKKIPLLFNPDVAYWTANGNYKIGAGLQTTDASTAVRCVYDEWYWVKADGTPDKCDISTFTWGDKEKVNPQN